MRKIMHAQDHRDWHALARSEGVNEWECPFDCMDPGAWDEENPGPQLYATVWYFRPGLDDKATGPTGYSVFSKGQMRAFAIMAAQRSGRAVRVELARN